jgi:2,4-dienoyl-CoA reductase-like NADH-dependent reductase (Old Yellow Enzyme family)
MSYRKVAQFRTPADLRTRLDELKIELPLDDEILTAATGSPLAAGMQVGQMQIGNRWCIQPMEGWDAQPDGNPSELTLRRWHHFGLSGAKLIWGGEAAAVRPDGRANPLQTMAIPQTRSGLELLRKTLLDAHHQHCGSSDDLLLGLQLTHSGRFCRPNKKTRWEPKIAYHHPLLDAKFGIDPADNKVVWSDLELADLIADYVQSAKIAAELGYQFVDIKACHGYLLHEFLSARQRPGNYGGDLAGRCRLLLEIIDAVRQACPDLLIGVRLSLFDTVPYQSGTEIGRPMDWPASTYDFGFGCHPERPQQVDLSEPLQLIAWLVEHGVELLNLTAGSPYYTPHLQRPAIFPPSDGYLPPEDPLCGVARQVQQVAIVKQHFPQLCIVGSGYTYLQDYLPHVAQAAVREGMVDFVGLGRMVLSYPDLPRDVLVHGQLARKRVCRTFSECTTAPRMGMVSGCYPLDPFYKARPERQILASLKQGKTT